MDETSSKSQIINYKLGKLELSLLRSGTFYLDGGAMFGVVPKVMWEKLTPSDSKNRIKLGLSCLIIRSGDKNVLIDTGICDMGEKFRKIFSLEEVDLDGCLEKIGLTPNDIDIVINTHLHFDHCGGNTRLKGENWVPSFPNAKYIVQEEEWEEATHSNERTQASYIPHTFIPIKEAGLLELVNGDIEILPGIKIIQTGGHTKGHQVVLLESDNKKALYLADLIPTSSHIKTPYVMGYDLYPLETMDKKRDLLGKAIKENWLLLFEHDPIIGMGYLEAKEGKMLFTPKE